MSNTPETGLEKAKELAEFCIACAEEKQAENPVLLPLGSASSVADYFVIASATSEPHLRALTGFLERQVREKFSLRTTSEAAEESGGWILLDFGTVIVHLMTPETREKYNLEALWGNLTAEKQD